LPKALRSLYWTGVFGFFFKNGSITMTLPSTLVMRVVAWPSHSTSTSAAAATLAKRQSAANTAATKALACALMRTSPGDFFAGTIVFLPLDMVIMYLFE
jgi:hypothetical protein